MASSAAAPATSSRSKQSCGLPKTTGATAHMSEELKYVGRAVKKIDADKLARGRAAFTDDFELRGMLYAKLLYSPHAHARIAEIDTARAERLAGVRAVLTYKNIPRVIFSSAGENYPEPPPYDQ